MIAAAVSPNFPVQIRAATFRDAPAINAIYRPYVTGTCISFELAPPSDADMLARLKRTLPLLPWLVCINEQGELAGYAYAGRYRERAAYQWAVETTVYVARDNQRRGIGRALYERLLAVLRKQGYCMAYAGITLPNAASVGLHEATGFTPVGLYRNAGYKFGAWHSVGWWQKLLQTLPVTPEPPRPFISRIHAGRR